MAKQVMVPLADGAAKLPAVVWRLYDGAVLRLCPTGTANGACLIAGDVSYPAEQCYASRKAAYAAARKELEARREAALGDIEAADKALDVLRRREKDNGDS